MQEGEGCPFLRGEHGGHQLVNRTEDTVRFLAFSTNGEPDIVLYPDSDKLGAFERLAPGEGLRASFASATRLSTTTVSSRPPGNDALGATARHRECEGRLVGMRRG